jgi:hypothetical protein
MHQRCLSISDVEYVVLHGQQHRCGGVVHYFLGRCNIPTKDQRKDCLSRLEGTTVLVDSHSRRSVVTVYRNRSALKSIRRKAKTNLKIVA